MRALAPGLLWRGLARGGLAVAGPLRAATTARAEYALEIAGFRQGGATVTKFISPEDRAKSAEIFARLVAVAKPGKEPEPEPAIKPTVTEETCRVKHVVGVSTVFSAVLERLNRRSVVSLALIAVTATVDQVVNIQMIYADGHIGEITGVVFVLTDGARVSFRVRTIEKEGEHRRAAPRS